MFLDSFFDKVYTQYLIERDPRHQTDGRHDAGVDVRCATVRMSDSHLLN